MKKLLVSLIIVGASMVHAQAPSPNSLWLPGGNIGQVFMLKGTSAGTQVFGPSGLRDTGTALTYNGTPLGTGSGTVVSVTGAAPLFTCTGTTAVTCALSTAAATTFFGNGTGAVAAPTFMPAATARTAMGAAPLANPAFTGAGSITTSFSIGQAGNPASTALTVTGSANGITPGLVAIVDNTTAVGTDYGFTHIAAALPTGGVLASVWGKAASNGNSFVLNWNQTAATTTNNWCLSVWGMASACNIAGFADGHVQFSGTQTKTTSTLASAATLVPTTGFVNVTGTVTVTAITPPVAFTAAQGGCITVFTAAAVPFTGGGSAANSISSPTFTSTAGTAYEACFNGTTWSVK